MDSTKLWEKLINEGYVPKENEIKLKKPLKIKTASGIKFISRLVKNNDGVKAYLVKSKYSGRLAN